MLFIRSRLLIMQINLCWCDFAEIIRFYPFLNSECDNYYYNRPFKILKYIIF